MKKQIFNLIIIILIMNACSKTDKDMNEFKKNKYSNGENYSYQTLYKAVNNSNYTKTKKIGDELNLNGIIDKQDSNGNTLLNIAVQNNDIQISKYLIDHEADINIQNKKRDSPYLYAGAEGKTKILDYMLEHGNPDEKIFNRYGGNALIPAAEKGHLDNVKLIIEKGNPDVNHKNNFGYTALIEAVALTDGSEEYQDIVQYLVDSGANINLKDNNDKTALDYAQDNNYNEIKDILINTYK